MPAFSVDLQALLGAVDQMSDFNERLEQSLAVPVVDGDVGPVVAWRCGSCATVGPLQTFDELDAILTRVMPRDVARTPKRSRQIEVRS